MDAPTWMQAIAAITETPVGVRLQADTDCVVGLVPLATFTDLALSHRSVHRKVMEAIGPVTRAGADRQRSRAPGVARHDGRGPGA